MYEAMCPHCNRTVDFDELEDGEKKFYLYCPSCEEIFVVIVGKNLTFKTEK